MHTMIQRFVDSGLFNEEVGNFIQNAFDNKESIIIAGHRSTGSRPLMAAMMGVAKQTYNAVQVKDVDGLVDDADYYLIMAGPNTDLDELMLKAIETGKPFVTLKSPETPFSIMRLFKQAVKEKGEIDQVYNQISLMKDGTGADAVPYTDRVDRYFVNEKGRVKGEKVDIV